MRQQITAGMLMMKLKDMRMGTFKGMTALDKKAAPCGCRGWVREKPSAAWIGVCFCSSFVEESSEISQVVSPEDTRNNKQDPKISVFHMKRSFLSGCFHSHFFFSSHFEKDVIIPIRRFGYSWKGKKATS